MNLLLLAAAEGGWFAANVGKIKQGVLVFFVLVFIGILIRLVLSRSDRYARAAQIPLDEKKVVDPRHK